MSTQPRGSPPQYQHIRASMPLVLNPYPRLCVQASVALGLAHKLTRLETPETHSGSLPAAYVVMVTFVASQTSEQGITSGSLRQASASEPLLNKNPDLHEPPITRPQLSPPWSPPQHWQIRPAKPLGHNPNPSLGFQASILGFQATTPLD